MRKDNEYVNSGGHLNKPLLLDVEERDAIAVPQQQHTGASIEDLVTGRCGHLLGHLILHVLDH